MSKNALYPTELKIKNSKEQKLLDDINNSPVFMLIRDELESIADMHPVKHFANVHESGARCVRVNRHGFTIKYETITDANGNFVSEDAVISGDAEQPIHKSTGLCYRFDFLDAGLKPLSDMPKRGIELDRIVEIFAYALANFLAHYPALNPKMVMFPEKAGDAAIAYQFYYYLDTPKPKEWL